MEKIFVIGISGGTASGKSTLADNISHNSKPTNIIVLRLDHYYVDHPELPLEKRRLLNYDCPEAFDVDLIVSHINALKSGKAINRPDYDFTYHCRKKALERIEPSPVVIVEGIMTLAIPQIRALIDFKIFVDTPADVRLSRRINRDINERGRTLENVIHQYLTTVRPMHNLYVEPSKVHADIIVPEGGYNLVALDLIVSRVQKMIEESSFELR
ncbi:MAG: uridine kinase [Bacilli bacterium]|nr:uridine kinase [Bacilli bacterium]MDD3389619.1 uridine kinase [Bacilli bacterium]MDD4344494.1 uridine kinase [Bacilli bacterium]MDD4521199.1 uridine kinase [Bacilli bacterium]MDY0399423.1 uridine kinase [Bacilli bacterium]